MSFDYEKLVQKALRGVVKELLQDVAEKGLPAPHHFYISFRTTYPGVQLPEAVKRANPKEVTIVLQHQFWDLKVTARGFSVVLNFQEVPQEIFVPFDALLSFMDPGTRFGLHFTPPPAVEATESETAPAEVPEPSEEAPAKVISLDTFRRR
jgi:hypothetical protein